MAFKQITDGLTLTVPESGTTNWARTVEVLAWTKISAHNHTGTGNGNKIAAAGLEDGSVTTAKLDDGAVTTVKLDDLAVTTAKLDNGAVTNAKLGTNAVTSTNILDNNVTSDKLADNISYTQSSTVTPTGTTATIDWNDGNFSVLDLSSATGTVTLTLNNPQTGGFYRIKVIQGATVRSVTFPGAVLFPGGVNPTLHQNINTVNVMYLDYDGTNYLGTLWDNELS